MLRCGMRIQHGTNRRECPQTGARIEYVSGSGDAVEIKIVTDDGLAIWIETDASDQGALDALVGRLTAQGQGNGHPAFDGENLERARRMRRDPHDRNCSSRVYPGTDCDCEVTRRTV